ncbi:hypothetical protein B1R32_1059 [Abditibacterium utsteinense]|uniref:Uncharacterized protein n=1 Tax=Abditibacterium utsteinense TaxID=1960156 RepID=A0A2S8SU68_9BACT|nr:hypothetical protein [Abditibacterium utsteinense]PQV64328.1 hypothetical protein B1R32_1059 [Abditibacterium utsteinense]
MCVFRFEREGFNSAEYLSKNLLSPAPYLDWHNGFCIAASDADSYDFEIQKQDVINFLMANYAELERLMSDGESWGSLDFGIANLISEAGFWSQSEYLQPELLRLAGNLGLTIGISRYAICNENQ